MPLSDTSEPAVHVSEPTGFRLATPTLDDGGRMWELAKATGTLDVNSRYSYVLWCRDFAATSVVANDGDRLAGFVTGYRRPADDHVLFVWQVAVSPSHRRQGLARRMLDHLTDRTIPHGVDHVEATVTPGNLPSTRLFTSFAAAREATLTRDALFSEEMLGSGHEPEFRFLIGPLGRR
ncbi:L-2,4-diaminobutyric acid acetyltransferase [Stackebrandtia albiflava]|uniref:L-2,4-diaminobutyric acid acetyltransferase n=1 Tax=Stackebrandtia albiflava TaxID=406432 RepID=A0A562UR79_9ACTN|nr:diaminobutyrate acetyltransferase [Stackebrandtia albiflava]TWJ08122.1 L-2,4-diaminobutyric acid acetyltransferase [Stackebrandtia albiflava]